jgi:hypothetical protein
LKRDIDNDYHYQYDNKRSQRISFFIATRGLEYDIQAVD